MMRFLIIFICITNCVFSQITTDSIIRDAKKYNLFPLSTVDQKSKKVLKNITTKSGWHIDHFAVLQNGYLDINAKQDYRTLNLTTYIYNDSVLYNYGSSKNYNHNQIIYDSVKIFNETPDFLFIKTSNVIDTGYKDIYAVPKKQAEDLYLFQDLIYEDYDNYIFIEYDPMWCIETNILKITNLKKGTIIEEKYKRNKSFGKFNTWKMEEIVYFEGLLTIKATLKHKKKDKRKTEIRKVKV